MYYITKKESKTGLKFQELIAERDKCTEAAVILSKKYGFEEWRQGYWKAFGGISSCIFKEQPDKKIWGKGAAPGEYMPKRNSKIGKQINQEFDELPTVSLFQLNKCIGWESSGFQSIGFSFGNDEYFGFSVSEKRNLTVPEDCEEVTTSRYRELFK